MLQLLPYRYRYYRPYHFFHHSCRIFFIRSILNLTNCGVLRLWNWCKKSFELRGTSICRTLNCIHSSVKRIFNIATLFSSKLSTNPVCSLSLAKASIRLPHNHFLQIPLEKLLLAGSTWVSIQSLQHLTDLIVKRFNYIADFPLRVVSITYRNSENPFLTNHLHR